MTTRSISAERVIHAPAPKIFSLLAEPARHRDIDGSGTVKGTPEGTKRAERVGDTFGMRMQLFGVPYRTVCEISELVPDRLIAWRPILRVGPVPVVGGQTWRYELEPADGGTLVRETYDWGTARAPVMLELARFPQRTAPSLDRTLERIAALVETR